ncbi:MAG: phospholipid carrier-dependent glycosyltransferase [Bulleidia sp.]|nr:phospholipid carrier-dependent glycosyltransferase [Bulleidia sp.]
MRELSYSIFSDSELLPLLLVLTAAYLIIRFIFQKMKPEEPETEPEEKHSSLPFVHSSKPKPVYNRKDHYWLTLLCVLYGIVSFWQLGSTKFPNTTWQPVATPQSVIFELQEDDPHFDSIYVIYGEGDNNSNPDSLQLGLHDISIEGSNDQNTWEPITTLNDGSIYQYSITSGDWNYRYIKLTSVNKNDTITELGFKAYGEERLLNIKVADDPNGASWYPAWYMIDEQDKVSLDPDYRYESYFDEVYHPRNAWEIANVEYMYAHVHPLLGTQLIAWSIHFFGMNPLAWRIPGVIFGILCLPAMYAILRLLFDKREYAAFGTFLLACDFMHLTTSRIATLEPFSVFWILVMFCWMIRYFRTSFYDTPFKETRKLLLWSGFFMGIGIATKWTACYSAIGLAILLFTNLIVRYQEYNKCVKVLAEKDNSSYTEEQLEECRHIIATFRPSFWKTIAWCFLYFIGIPAVIYFLAYIPCPVWRDGWSIKNVLAQIEYMYNYHANLKATHPYQSTWYQWIFDIRPIWYYGRMSRNGVYHSISCFSNPLICWAGVPAILDVIYHAVKDKDGSAWVIMVGYLTALLPWVLFINRCVFAYHFYPTSFFMIMAIVYAVKKLLKLNPKLKTAVNVYAIAVLVLFFLFLPATAGFGTTTAYLKVLEWFPTWYFG